MHSWSVSSARVRVSARFRVRVRVRVRIARLERELGQREGDEQHEGEGLEAPAEPAGAARLRLG